MTTFSKPVYISSILVLLLFCYAFYPNSIVPFILKQTGSQTLHLDRYSILTEPFYFSFLTTFTHYLDLQSRSLLSDSVLKCAYNCEASTTLCLYSTYSLLFIAPISTVTPYSIIYACTQLNIWSKAIFLKCRSSSFYHFYGVQEAPLISSRILTVFLTLTLTNNYFPFTSLLQKHVRVQVVSFVVIETAGSRSDYTYLLSCLHWS